MLEKNNWSEENYNILLDLIEKYKSEKDTDKYDRNYVVTDWDNTSAAFDIQENTVLYQIISLDYACNPEEFEELIYKDLRDQDLDEDTRILIKDILADFSYLYEKGLSYKDLKDDPIYKDFLAKFAYFIYVFVNSLDYARSARKFLHTFYKMTEDQVRELTRSAIKYFKDYPDYRMKLSANLSDKRKIEVEYKVGLREIKDQVNLFNSLREANIDIYICSASSMLLVEEFSSSDLFSYNFKKGQTIGLLQEKDGDGKFSLDFVEENLTYLEGKANYMKKLEEKYKKPAILYMGDSIGDFYALSYPNLKFGLILEFKEAKSSSDLIEKIKRLENNTKYFYQEKDEYTGLFTNK